MNLSVGENSERHVILSYEYSGWAEINMGNLFQRGLETRGAAPFLLATASVGLWLKSFGRHRLGIK